MMVMGDKHCAFSLFDDVIFSFVRVHSTYVSRTVYVKWFEWMWKMLLKQLKMRNKKKRQKKPDIKRFTKGNLIFVCFFSLNFYIHYGYVILFTNIFQFKKRHNITKTNVLHVSFSKVETQYTLGKTKKKLIQKLPMWNKLSTKKEELVKLWQLNWQIKRINIKYGIL